jgi:hypothetical protein
MNKTLISALVVTAIAGVVVALYLNDPETFNDTVDDLKDKANEGYKKVKKGLSKSKDTAEEALS